MRYHPIDVDDNIDGIHPVVGIEQSIPRIINRHHTIQDRPVARDR